MIEQASLGSELLVALLGMFVVIGFYAFRAPEERRALLLLAVAAYILKVILVPVYYWVLVEGGARGFAFRDGAGYNLSQKEMAYEVTRGLPHASVGWSYKDPGYNLIITGLYVVFGASTFLARLFNACVSTLTLLYVYRIARISFDERVARISARLVAFFPSSLFIIVDHRKEGPIIFVATLLFYHALRMMTQQRGWTSSIPIFAVWLIPTYFLRSGFVLPFLGLLLVTFFFTRRSIVAGGVVSVLLVAVLLAARFVFPESLGMGVEGSVESVEGRLGVQARDAEVSSGLLRFAKITSPVDVWKLPLAAVLELILPFPPLIKWGAPIYSYIFSWSQLVFIALLPQFFLGAREVFQAEFRRVRLPLFIYSAGFLAVIGGLASGVGRYRETILPVILVLTAAGIRARQNRMFSFTIYTGLSILAMLVYLNRFISGE